MSQKPNNAPGPAPSQVVDEMQKLLAQMLSDSRVFAAFQAMHYMANERDSAVMTSITSSPLECGHRLSIIAICHLDDLQQCLIDLGQSLEKHGPVATKDVSEGPLPGERVH
jgi:hypothetical protein